MFYIADPFNGPNWAIIQEFTHRHLWDILEIETTHDENTQDRVNFLQDDNSSNFVLTINLGELPLLTNHRNDVVPEVISDHMIPSSHQSVIDDDFIDDTDEKDETLEDYLEKDDDEDDSESDN